MPREPRTLTADPQDPRADLRARAAERSRSAARKAAEKATRRRGWPRWTGAALKACAVALPVLALGAGAAWLVQSGGIGRTAERLGDTVVGAAAGAGLIVREVMVEGRGETPREEIMNALGVARGAPILGLDLERARTDLERLPWVATATVERRLPDTVFVRLTERRPLALWQREGRLSLIDTDGVVLTERDLGRYRNLPIIVGADAPRHAGALLDALAEVPAVAKHVQAAVRVGGRRWDLRLDSGVAVRLPETEIRHALRQLAEVVAKHPLLERDVVAIDLRLPDRLVVQTSPGSAERRRLPQEKI